MEEWARMTILRPSVLSILYKIFKFCRSSRLRQAVRGLMTEFSERFPSFHCLRCQTLMWGNRLFCNDVEKMIPWRVAKKNTMEKLLKPNPLCINAKLQMPVYVNGPFSEGIPFSGISNQTKKPKQKEKNYIFDFYKCLHVLYSVFSILYKIFKFCRSSRLRQAVRGLMTEFSERFPSFHRCQTLNVQESSFL